VRHRANLTILRHAHVTRVLLAQNEATGVEVLHQGQRRTIAAAREVILSAGALVSPQLLMLSGLGDGAQLQRHGIPIQHDLPGVGRNLQDHWYVTLVWRAMRQSSVNHRLNGLRKYLEGARYLLTRAGYLAQAVAPVTAYAASEPRGGCRHHADHPNGQHQRALHHDWRKRRGHDSSGCIACARRGNLIPAQSPGGCTTP